MIDYDPKDWLGVVLQMRGSVLPRLLPRIALVVVLGVVAAYGYDSRGARLPTAAHAMVGVALGLLLVFRTNASFDRWWEARKLLGTMVNRCRDLTRQATTLVDGGAEADDGRRLLQRRLSAYFALVRQHLRGERDLTKLGLLLDERERRALEEAKHRPAVMLTWVSAVVADWARQGRVDGPRLTVMDANVTTLHDALGGCERLLRTPVPFAYAQHIKTFLVLFCVTAPFALVEQMRWLTPLASGVLAFALFGIDEIGVEIEDPFGYDPNDLPLDAIGEGIGATTAEIVERPRP